MLTRDEVKSVSAELIVRTFNDDLKEVVHKWIKKIEANDILEFDETRMKMDFMIARSKLDFMNKLGFLDNVGLLMDSIDALEEDLKEHFKKAVIRIFADQVIAALKKPFFK